MPRISGREFNIEAGRQGGKMRSCFCFMKIPLDPQVGVAHTVGTGSPIGAEDGKKWCIQVKLQLVWQAKIQFVISGILTKIWILRVLKNIELVKEFEVPLAFLRYRRVVCIKRQLRRQRFSCSQAGQQQSPFS